MTRLGWLLLIGFLAIVGGFAAILHKGRGVSVPKPTAPATQPVTPPPAASAAAGGGLAIPVSGVLPAQLHDTWGEARASGAREHHAIDILAPRGTPVVAAASGTVEKIFESRDGGHTMYIRRDDPGFIDYYAHLDAYAPNLIEGMKIAQGQLIGTVGSTGDASADAPHLHYEIKQMGAGEKWWQGTDINPYPILAGQPASR